MGEAKDSGFRLEFNHSIRVESRDERLSSDAGALLTRDIGERLGVWDYLHENLLDPRKRLFVTHPLRELVRTSVCMLAQGWRDQDDADALRQDPVLRLAVSDRGGASPLLAAAPFTPDGLASQPTLSRMVSALALPENRRVLRHALLRTAAGRLRSLHAGCRLDDVTVDVDSLPLEVFGEQAGSAWNGHYHARVMHPLLASLGEEGDLLDARLRAGNAHTAEGSLEFILPLLDDVERHIARRASLRIDAGFPEPDLLAALHDRGTRFVARLARNSILTPIAQEAEEEVRQRAMMGESGEWCIELGTYQADTWKHAQRLVLVVVRDPGELFVRSFFLLTSWTSQEKPAEALLALYRRRGSAESHYGEWKDVLVPALSSTTRTKTHYRGKTPRRRTASRDAFACNEVLLLMHALAYQLMHTGRSLAATAAGEGMSLRRFRESALKVAARITLHGRRVLITIAKSAAGLWNSLTRSLRSLRPAPA